MNFAVNGTELLRLDADPSVAKLNILNSGTPTAVSLGINDDNTGLFSPGTDQLGIATGGVETVRIDSSTTAGDIRLWLYDASADSLKRVTLGATDSGGTGFKVLRVSN